MGMFLYNLGEETGFRNGQTISLHRVKNGEVYLDDEGNWQRTQKEGEQTEPNLSEK